MWSRLLSRHRWVVPVLLALSLLAFVPLELGGCLGDALGVGGFVAAALTVFFLTYATIDQWRDAKLRRRPVFWFYVVQKPWRQPGGDEDIRTGTLFRNLARVPIKMYVSLQPTLNGQQAHSGTLGAQYSRKDFVLLGPEDQVNGNFSLSRLLAENGQTMGSMRASSNADNRERQLRLTIRIGCEDPYGNRYDHAEGIEY